MNPILGVFYHWLGGLASGSFYVPFRGVKRWSWETSWLVAGVFSWIIAPWFFATLNTTDVITVLSETPGKVWLWACLFGALWGLGGLTFGLTMRYLGMSLGMAVALGYCTVFGTLIPPIFAGEFASKLLEKTNGQWVLAGLFVCVLGIVVTALAGRAKEGEMTEAQKRDTVKEFDFKKGILVATFSGIMSACFAFGLSAGDRTREITFTVDMQNSAKAEGKTITRTAEPSEEEAKTLLEALKLTDADGKEIKTLAGLLGLLEEPRTLQGKIAALKAANTADSADELKKLEDSLPKAVERSATASAAIGTATPPLAGRVAAYARQFGGIADDKVRGIVDNLTSLSEKETALNVSASGADLVAIHGKHSLWTGLPVLIIVLLGGFATNFIWCVILNIRNRTGYEYLASTQRHPAHGKDSTIIENATDAPAVEMAEQARRGNDSRDRSIPLVSNYLFAALAGVTWYFQFFFYSMGETQMGDYKFSSWTLHMASIIIFSSIWGLALKEWKGASSKSKGLLFAGLALLVLSTVIIGYGNYIGDTGGGH